MGRNVDFVLEPSNGAGLTLTSWIVDGDFHVFFVCERIAYTMKLCHLKENETTLQENYVGLNIASSRPSQNKAQKFNQSRNSCTNNIQ